MAHPVSIKTPRLILSCFEKGDALDLYESKKETWAGLTKTFAWAAYGLNLESDRDYVQKCRDDFKAGKDFNFVAREKDSGKAISFSGIHPVHKAGDDVYQFGLWVRQSAQGKGYAPEIVNGLIRYGFDALGAKKIIGCHIPSNEGSKKLFNKVGMEFEETRPLSLVIGGGIKSDAHWYKMDTPDLLPAMDVDYQ